MSKAILVMDMPESCDMCDLCEDSGISCYCGAPSIGENVDDYIVCRPDWCPLRPVPEKMEVCGTYNADYYAKGGKPPSYKVGWNACIDAITNSQT